MIRTETGEETRGHGRRTKETGNKSDQGELRKEEWNER